jgi:hypothetical protein
MGQESFRVQDFYSFMPSVEPTRANAIFALSGKNFRFDSIGPYSAFGNRLLTPAPIVDPAHVQGVTIPTRTGDRTFTFVKNGILEWQESVGGWVWLYVTGDTTVTPNRWTWAYLSLKIYFCHPVTGLLVYDLDSDLCLPARDVAGAIGIPDDPLAVCENNGRLVVLTPVMAAYSAQSNGIDYNPRLGGAGFQVLTGRISGYPITITSYSGGVLIWTNGGIMRGEFAGGSEVYRWRALNFGFRPWNSMCVIRIDQDTSIFLDERGLFQTRGEEPTPFAPMFNEFLIRYIKANNMTVGQNLRLEWDARDRLLYVSVSLTYANPIYEKCFVLYPSIDKWGQFNDAHYGILPIRIDNGPRAGRYFSYVDDSGHLRVWQETGSKEIQPTDSLVNLVLRVQQIPVHVADSGTSRVASSSLNAMAFYPLDHPGRESYYPWDGSVPTPPSLTGLDAFVRFGLFRGSKADAADSLAEINQLVVRSTTSGLEEVQGEDWNLEPPSGTEDWDSITGHEDWGFGDMNYVNHGLKVIGTIDGRTTFVEEEPSLVRFSAAGRYFSCTVQGIWHIIEMSATEVGEGFRPKTLDITFSEAGRLT